MPFSPRTGSDLLADIATFSHSLPVLVPDFLYGQTVTMLAADPGAGKSIISMQLALSLTSATPLFGTLPIPEPKRVYYLQLEGAYHHSLERLRLMQTVIPLSAEKLCWDMGEGLNVMREQDCLNLEKRIATFGKPDLIILDPMYMAVSGGLAEDRSASAFVRFSNRLLQTFGCSLWHNHHTHRTRYAKDGEEVQESDPFYGSQWLKAHMDASWHLSRNASNKVRLECKKDRNSSLTHRIDLVYHEDSMTCENILYQDSAAMTRVMNFLSECKKRNMVTTFAEIQSKTGVSHAHLRRLKNEIGRLGIVDFINSNGKSTSWVPR